MVTSSNRAGKSLLLTGFLLLLAAASLPATAATFTVNSTGDTVDADLADGVCADAQGACSLRAAIMQANAIGGTNTIDLSLINDPNNPIILNIPGADETCSGNATDGFVVTSAHDDTKGDLNITSSMNLVGAGPDKTIIEWDPSVKQDPATGDRVFHIEAVSSNIDVSISGVTIRNGVTPPPLVVVTNFDGTFYQLERWGAGIAIGPAAAVTLIDPSVSGSETGTAGDEGGAGSGGSDEGASAAVVNSVTLTNVRILDNQSGTAGGGISSAAPLTLDHVLVSGNTGVTTGGGIYNDAQLTIKDSTIGTMTGFTDPNLAERGGGVFDTGMHNTVIEESAIIGNKAVYGGGISSRSLVMMDITNSTVARNEATDVGAGITTNGSVSLKNDTIADNAAANDSTSGAAGLNAFGSGVYDFVNTAFQNNLATGPGVSANCGCSGSTCAVGAMVSRGHNIADDGTCFLNTSLFDIANTSAQLQPLAGNGGPTETMALLMNTPAVDAGDNANCPNTDQRGAMRPADGNLKGNMTCDIGAFELFAPTNDLHLSGLRAPDSVLRGQPAEVGFDFTDAPGASADASGVMITTGPLPEAYALTGSTVSVAGRTTDCLLDTQSRIVTCDVGTLTRGDTATLDLQGVGTTPGQLEITAHVSASAPVDPFPDNNTGTARMTVQGYSDISVAASGSGRSPHVNGQAPINYTVRNLGPDPATNVRVLARFQDKMAYQRMNASNGATCAVGSDGTYATCDLGSLAAGQSVTGTLNLKPTSTGDAIVELQVTTDDYDGNVADNTATVITIVRGNRHRH